tara:strand:- start:55 stop:375 length:321 start_codon:yes stop_codon:yes gene_type:complete
MSNYKIFSSIDGLRDMTDIEKTQHDKDIAKSLTEKQKKLKIIKQIRLEKLIETDYLAMSDNTMSDEMKAFRKSMRDIPQDYSEDKYDELLSRDDNGNLTHSVWSKP